VVDKRNFEVEKN
jgi:hypothetical protein